MPQDNRILNYLVVPTNNPPTQHPLCRWFSNAKVFGTPQAISEFLCLSLKRHHYSQLGHWWQQFWGASELDGSSVPTFEATQIKTDQSLFHSEQWQRRAPQLVASLPSQIMAELKEYFCLFVCCQKHDIWGSPRTTNTIFKWAGNFLFVSPSATICLTECVSSLIVNFTILTIMSICESVFSWSFLLLL